MLVHHATLERLLPSIHATGLDPRRSKTKRRAVYLHTAGMSTWAMLHAVRRHGGRIEEVCIIDVDMPRSWLRRTGKRGLWYCQQVITPDRFRGIRGFASMSVSPLEEVSCRRTV